MTSTSEDNPLKDFWGLKSELYKQETERIGDKISAVKIVEPHQSESQSELDTNL